MFDARVCPSSYGLLAYFHTLVCITSESNHLLGRLLHTGQCIAIAVLHVNRGFVKYFCTLSIS